MVVGNADTLRGGIQLVPDVHNDGLLDVVLFAPRGFQGEAVSAYMIANLGHLILRAGRD